MSVDYGQMNPHELEVFASGYLEAITDHTAELERLRAEITRLAAAADDARADAEAAFQQAFNARQGRAAAVRAVRGIDIIHARRHDDH